MPSIIPATPAELIELRTGFLELKKVAAVSDEIKDRELSKILQVSTGNHDAVPHPEQLRTVAFVAQNSGKVGGNVAGRLWMDLAESLGKTDPDMTLKLAEEAKDIEPLKFIAQHVIKRGGKPPAAVPPRG